ncbi:MAG: hypothetical protein F4X59_12020 [Holophagales bacterium]|nr:hypothetical protein [Holophagales bacterium]MYC10842.1 hypothetical protein [Holophagales bacterium]
MKKAIAAAVLVGLLLVLTTTRFGIFIVFDVLGDVGSDNLPTDPTAGPLVLSGALRAKERIPLPESLEQASGLHVDGQHIYVSTDQAELFTLSHTGVEARPVSRLLGGPLILRQGRLEGIAVDRNRLLGIGELGALRSWRYDEERWQPGESTALPDGLENLEFTGITRFGTDLLATADDGLDIWNLGTGDRHQLDLGSYLRPGRSADGLLVSGITADASSVYLVTENYASILRVDPIVWRVLDVWGIDAGESSDIAVLDGSAYVTVDHNYFDPRPPLLVYELPRSPDRPAW